MTKEYRAPWSYRRRERGKNLDAETQRSRGKRRAGSIFVFSAPISVPLRLCVKGLAGQPIHPLFIAFLTASLFECTCNWS